MNALLMPAAALMGRLHYLHKFSLIFMLFLVPLGVLSSILLTEINDDIEFLEQERRGVEYIAVVRQLLEHIPQHRGMTAAYLNGDVSFKDKILGKRRVIDQDFANLASVDTKLGDALSTDNKLGTLKGQWDQLKANAFNMAATESFTEHSSLINEIIGLIAHAADTSNLILDPELDTYYLMDAVVNRLPPLTDAMGQARGLGAGAAANGGLTEDKKIRLAVLMDRVMSGNKSLGYGLKVAVSENDEIGSRLNGLDGAAVEGADQFFHLVTSQLLEPSLITVKANKVFGAGTEAIGAAFELYDTILPRLDGILADRVASGKRGMQLSMLTVAVVLLLLAYLFTGFYTSVVESIRHINRATQQLAEGDLTARIKVNVRDELKLVADSGEVRTGDDPHHVVVRTGSGLL